jgi:hypothetical protein
LFPQGLKWRSESTPPRHPVLFEPPTSVGSISDIRKSRLVGAFNDLTSKAQQFCSLLAKLPGVRHGFSA